MNFLFANTKFICEQSLQLSCFNDLHHVFQRNLISKKNEIASSNMQYLKSISANTMYIYRLGQKYTNKQKDFLYSYNSYYVIGHRLIIDDECLIKVIVEYYGDFMNESKIQRNYFSEKSYKDNAYEFLRSKYGVPLEENSSYSVFKNKYGYIMIGFFII